MRRVQTTDRRIRGTAAALAIVASLIVCFVPPIIFIPWGGFDHWLRECPVMTSCPTPGPTPGPTAIIA